MNEFPVAHSGTVTLYPWHWTIIRRKAEEIARATSSRVSMSAAMRAIIEEYAHANAHANAPLLYTPEETR